MVEMVCVVYSVTMVLMQVYSISKGVPRIINSLATASLVYACSKQQNGIDEETVYQGQKDFDDLIPN